MKMIVIPPVVFCVVSLGIASMDSLRKAGRIGVKALATSSPCRWYRC